MGVMDGIKILELARVPPAEMPAMMLADMGAEVLKIDSPDPERPEGEEWVRRTIHSFTNRNKRSMTHDMNYLSLAGVLNLIGDAGSKKPVIPLNLVADYAGASLHGALGIVLALFGRERTGRGQHVDVSYLDTTVSLLAATPNMRFFFS